MYFETVAGIWGTSYLLSNVETASLVHYAWLFPEFWVSTQVLMPARQVLNLVPRLLVTCM